MIRRLQKKFISVTMCCSFAVLFILLASVNFIYIYTTRRETTDTFETLIENNGSFPSSRNEMNFDIPSINPEKPFKTRYFAIQTDSAGNVQYISVDKVASVNMSDAITMARAVLSLKKSHGAYGIYRYSVTDKYYGKLIIFIDCREQMETANILLIASLILLAFIMAVLFVLVSVFSKRAMKPVADSYEKQKQFITDAGHELKTPLAIISANTDVIEMCGEKSEWTDSIHYQVKRMDSLVKSMIELSRMNEQTQKQSFAEFDLSQTVTQTASEFNTLAATQNRNFELSVQSDIMYNGNQESIKRLVSVLCDNAVKYSDYGGFISVQLCKRNRSIILSVFNTCENIDREKLDKLFDRFYRADESRSRETGGYGIGLSMAKAIVDTHKGKIKAESADGKSVVFTVTL